MQFNQFLTTYNSSAWPVVTTTQPAPFMMPYFYPPQYFHSVGGINQAPYLVSRQNCRVTVDCQREDRLQLVGQGNVYGPLIVLQKTVQNQPICMAQCGNINYKAIPNVVASCEKTKRTLNNVATNIPHEPVKDERRVGSYTIFERRKKIAKYKEKLRRRREKNPINKVYKGRSDAAIRRKREYGRFAKAR